MDFLSDYFVPSELPPEKDWQDRYGGKVSEAYDSDDCSGFLAAVLAAGWKNNGKSTYLHIFSSTEVAEQDLAHWQIKWTRLAFKPTARLASALASARRTATIPFSDPNGIEKGYVNLGFDVEYQFVTCFDELHIAYSIVEDSVRPIDKRLGVGYALHGRVYRVKSPTTILSLPLKGTVYFKDRIRRVGTFADDHAAKAIAWGCFTGQTKPLAKLSELKIGADKQPTKKEFERFTENLAVNFETVQILTSTAAEQEIDSGAAEASNAHPATTAAPKGEPDAADVQEAKNKAAEERAARKAAEEAEFQAKQKAYEDGMAAHQAAVEQYNKSLADNAAQLAESVAKAKAVQEEFARKRAEYEAEAARAKQAQADYEAKYRKPQ